jgi:NAD(P)-dependent dehydrogenase (short-subunit alcohol dehydrogenase family)
MKSERKVAVITGASRGISAVWLGAYRDVGYHVDASSRSIDESHDPSIPAVDSDIASAKTAGRIPGLVIEHYGRIDTLLNNAGLLIAKPFTEYSEADFATMARVNLAGFVHLTQRAVARMLLAGSGPIVSITATIAVQPMASLAAALGALTKGGLNAITRLLAIEHATRNVRVNGVSPGAIATPMHAAEAHGFQSVQQMVRMAERQEAVDTVMSSERAASESMHVDGGAYAGRW